MIMLYSVCMYIYIYIYIERERCICMYVYKYIYIYIERERERDKALDRRAECCLWPPCLGTPLSPIRIVRGKFAKLCEVKT